MGGGLPGAAADVLVVWTNEYEKACVFGTTLGHHNATMSHDVCLDILIIVDGDRVTIKVDGETVTRYTERNEDIKGKRRLASGTFGLQAHDPNSRVYFRDVYVRPIDGAFEGESLDSE